MHNLYKQLKTRCITDVTVHDGVFHADDVYVCALAKLINPDINIIRTRNPAEMKGLIADVGGGEYDHHPGANESKELRPNGIPYAAFGKVWRDIGVDFAENMLNIPRERAQKTAEVFDLYFVEPIDKLDNGIESNDKKRIYPADIWIFNRTSLEPPGTQYFKNALAVAETDIIRALHEADRRLDRKAAKEHARRLVEEALPDMKNGILLLPQYCDFTKPVYYHPEIKMVVLPKQNNIGFLAYGAPADKYGIKRRCCFPKEWAVGEDASKVSGIKEMTFCYNPTGFMASFNHSKTPDAAIEACETAVQRYAQS